MLYVGLSTCHRHELAPQLSNNSHQSRNDAKSSKHDLHDIEFNLSRSNHLTSSGGNVSHTVGNRIDNGSSNLDVATLCEKTSRLNRNTSVIAPEVSAVSAVSMM